MTRKLTLACFAILLMSGPAAAKPPFSKKYERTVRACASHVMRALKIPKKNQDAFKNVAGYCVGLKREALELAAKGATKHLDLAKRGMARASRADRE